MDGALASLLRDRSALLVASTDLSHLHSYDAVVRLGEIVLKRIGAYDQKGLANDLRRGGSLTWKS